MEEPSAVYARARKLVNCIEFQLQQLEEQDAASSRSSSAFGASAGTAALGGSGGVAASLADDDSMRRHAITENMNRLTAEVAGLERCVLDAYGGVAAASAKSELWRKCVAFASFCCEQPSLVLAGTSCVGSLDTERLTWLGFHYLLLQTSTADASGSSVDSFNCGPLYAGQLFADEGSPGKRNAA